MSFNSTSYTVRKILLKQIALTRSHMNILVILYEYMCKIILFMADSIFHSIFHSMFH